MVSRVIISIEDPGRPDIQDLLVERDRFFDLLYAEQPRIPKGVDLGDPHLIFFALRWDGKLAGCGALVAGQDYGELKRIYVSSSYRGLGLGRRIVEAIEEEARRRGQRLLRLETGIRQAEALNLYASLSYRRTGPFGRYGADPLSIFMEKRLAASEPA